MVVEVDVDVDSAVAVGNDVGMATVELRTGGLSPPFPPPPPPPPPLLLLLVTFSLAL